MYNHKVKKVKFLFCKSKLLKEKTKVGNVCVFFLENVGNSIIKCTSKIKRFFCWFITYMFSHESLINKNYIFKVELKKHILNILEANCPQNLKKILIFHVSNFSFKLTFFSFYFRCI